MPRRKKNFSENQSRTSLSINKDKPIQRNAANARERARMRVLSRAFCRLKTTLPWVPADTKLSKLDTLRLAASYIGHLKGILREETLGTSESSLHPAMSMTWPFGFNRPLGGSTGGSQQGGSLEGSEVDDEDDDGESISSCTWEEVSPTPKDCIHLDNPRPSRTRGKANQDSSQPSAHDSSTLARNGNRSSSAVHNAIITPTTSCRPLSQTQHHHHYSTTNTLCHESKFNPLDSLGMMTGTNLENAPPPLLQPTHNEMHVGIGMPEDENGSFTNDMTNACFVHHSHQHHHQQHHQNALKGDNQSVHQLVPSGTFGYSSDLMSIG